MHWYLTFAFFLAAVTLGLGIWVLIVDIIDCKEIAKEKGLSFWDVFGVSD